MAKIILYTHQKTIHIRTKTLKEAEHSGNSWLRPKLGAISAQIIIFIIIIVGKMVNRCKQEI